MTYFVTGATGFIGRHLVERLLERDGDIHVLVREGSQERLDALVERWGRPERIKPVVGGQCRPPPAEEQKPRSQKKRAIKHKITHTAD